MTSDTNTVAITYHQLIERERDGTCPVESCQGQLTWLHLSDDVDSCSGTRRSRGGFWVCSLYPTEWANHYQLSPGGGTKGTLPRETRGVVPAWTPPVPGSSGPRIGRGVVLRRRRHGQIIPL